MGLSGMSQRFLSSGLMIRIHKGADKQSKTVEEASQLITWVGEPPGLPRGIDPFRRSAVGLGDQGAGLLI